MIIVEIQKWRRKKNYPKLGYPEIATINIVFPFFVL